MRLTVWVGLSSLGTATYKFVKAKPAERKEMGKDALVTTATASVTSTIGDTINGIQVDHIYDKYSSAYMESRSDAELSDAYKRLEYLDSLSDDELAVVLQQKHQLQEEDSQSTKTL